MILSSSTYESDKKIDKLFEIGMYKINKQWNIFRERYSQSVIPRYLSISFQVVDVRHEVIVRSIQLFFFAAIYRDGPFNVIIFVITRQQFFSFPSPPVENYTTKTITRRGNVTWSILYIVRRKMANISTY